MDFKDLVISFGEQIGVPYGFYRNARSHYDWRDQWHDILHELGHLAIFPDAALLEYQQARQQAALLQRPSANLIPPGLIDPNQELLAALDFYPNEYAVRCWCLDALQLLDLPNPVADASYRSHPPGRRERNPAQWLEPPPLFRGREQLNLWQIDVLNNRPRPANAPLTLVPGSYCPVDRAGFAAEVAAQTIQL